MGMFFLVVSWVLLAVKGFALVDAAMRKPNDYEIANTLKKSAWLLILALALVTHLVWRSPFSFLNLAGTVAALVYLAQLRGSQHSY